MLACGLKCIRCCNTGCNAIHGNVFGFIPFMRELWQQLANSDYVQKSEVQSFIVCTDTLVYMNSISNPTLRNGQHNSYYF